MSLRQDVKDTILSLIIVIAGYEFLSSLEKFLVGLVGLADYRRVNPSVDMNKAETLG